MLSQTRFPLGPRSLNAADELQIVSRFRKVRIFVATLLYWRTGKAIIHGVLSKEWASTVAGLSYR